VILINLKINEMVAEIQVGKCEACCPRPDGPFLVIDAGPGRFPDFDSDYAEGIPVCHFCGGLGRQSLDDAEFQSSVKKISLLRGRYCPISDEVREKMTREERKEILAELIREMEAHYNKYGYMGVEGCFAQKFLKNNNRVSF